MRAFMIVLIAASLGCGDPRKGGQEGEDFQDTDFDTDVAGDDDDDDADADADTDADSDTDTDTDTDADTDTDTDTDTDADTAASGHTGIAMRVDWWVVTFPASRPTKTVPAPSLFQHPTE